jgi:UPF0176 protein
MSEAAKIVVATFYKFVLLEDFRQQREPLQQLCQQYELRGTILLAPEGINATVAGSREGIDRLGDFLRAEPRFAGLEYKESCTDEVPFYRMKIRLKREIVTMGMPETEAERVSGIHVDPEQWNALLNDPEVTVIDARNQYECDIGMFKNAVSPVTNSFREFPEYVANNLDPGKHKKIAMYCTGGIRCEKASAYMLQQGFSEVYQLHGGILRYLAEANPGKNLWQGECFVFDGRVAVNDDLQPGIHQMCYSCRMPLSPEDRQSEKYQAGVSCPDCFDGLTPQRRSGLEERQRQITLAEQRNQRHIGVPFNPDRSI